MPPHYYEKSSLMQTEQSPESILIHETHKTAPSKADENSHALKFEG